MTAFDYPYFTDLKMVPVEDPMELSTDMEKRFLGDEDIDIDLSLDGRSPYAQEDENMLEDTHFTEDQGQYDGQQEGNDDEMADEPEATEDVDEIQEDQQGDNVQDLDEFDILVDDEEIPDVEDTVIFSDNTTGRPSTFLYQVGESSEHQNYNQFSEPSYANHTNETYHETPHSDGFKSQSVDFLHTYARKPEHDTGILTSIAEQADAKSHTTDMPERIFIQEQATPSQKTGDEFVEASSDNLLQGGSTVQPLVLAQEEAKGEEEAHDHRSDGSPNRNQLGGGSPDRTPRNREEVAEQIIPDGRSDPETQLGVQSENQEAYHPIPDDHGTETVAFDAAAESFEEQGKDGAPENETNSLHDYTPLHPVVVVYQESEILLFPPHEHGEEQAQTYFLEDESLATQTIQSLLRACRLVLADSINEDYELELKITSLGLEICETSNASTSTTLAQILDIYLKLQHNDGLDDPVPLQMTLTTKLSFPRRLEYLHSAAAGGVGFHSIKAKYEYKVEFDEGSEYEGDNLQEYSESFKTQADGATEEGSTLTEGYDGAVNNLHAPNSDTNYRDELEPAEPAIGSTPYKHTVEDEGSQTQGEVPRPQVTVQGSKMQPQQDGVRTADDPAHHSLEDIEPFHGDSAAKIGSEEHGEGKQIFSPSCSTLRDDGSDVAGERDHNLLESFQLAAGDSDYSASQWNEIGGDVYAVADTDQPELSNQGYEEDGDIFDLEEIEDVVQDHVANQDYAVDEDHAADQDHGESSLSADRNHQPNEGEQEVYEGFTSMLVKEVSKGNSDIDNDEITYDDEEDNDNVEATQEDVNGTNGPGNSPRGGSESKGVDHQNGIAGGQRESLKRLRPGEDEEPVQGDDTQDLKRVRSK